jgi:hypothetical protein
MDSTDTGENQSILLSELSLIQQLVIQLESQLRLGEPSNSTIELFKSIVPELLSRTDKSLFLAKSCGYGFSPREPPSPPRSATASPASGMSEATFRCHDDNDDNNTNTNTNNNNNNKRDVSKKRFL